MNNQSGKTILLIDDDRDILEALKIMLETEGFTVQTASNGQQGVEIVKKSCPSLVLVDMMMETVDAGAKVAEQIKSTGCNCPVLLLSSIGDATSYNLDIAEIGLAGAIQKPVRPQVLIPLIKRKLGLK
ncbi:MAG: response regulator [Candidatus Glassbacteria bacterium]